MWCTACTCIVWWHGGLKVSAFGLHIWVAFYGHYMGDRGDGGHCDDFGVSCFSRFRDFFRFDLVFFPLPVFFSYSVDVPTGSHFSSWGFECFSRFGWVTACIRPHELVQEVSAQKVGGLQGQVVGRISNRKCCRAHPPSTWSRHES